MAKIKRTSSQLVLSARPRSKSQQLKRKIAAKEIRKELPRMPAAKKGSPNRLSSVMNRSRKRIKAKEKAGVHLGRNDNWRMF